MKKENTGQNLEIRKLSGRERDMERLTEMKKNTENGIMGSMEENVW